MYSPSGPVSASKPVSSTATVAPSTASPALSVTVPVTPLSRATWSAAALASTMPTPYRVSGVPGGSGASSGFHAVSSIASIAVWRSRPPPAAERTSANTPVLWGADIEVPEYVPS